jgi:hypothetical protein
MRLCQSAAWFTPDQTLTASRRQRRIDRAATLRRLLTPLRNFMLVHPFRLLKHIFRSLGMQAGMRGSDLTLSVTSNYLSGMEGPHGAT